MNRAELRDFIDTTAGAGSWQSEAINIAVDTYAATLTGRTAGTESRPVHLITASLALACGHDGHDPGSYLASEVTCADCLTARTP